MSSQKEKDDQTTVFSIKNEIITEHERMEEFSKTFEELNSKQPETEFDEFNHVNKATTNPRPSLVTLEGSDKQLQLDFEREFNRISECVDKNLTANLNYLNFSDSLQKESVSSVSETQEKLKNCVFDNSSNSYSFERYIPNFFPSLSADFVSNEKLDELLNFYDNQSNKESKVKESINSAAPKNLETILDSTMKLFEPLQNINDKEFLQRSVANEIDNAALEEAKQDPRSQGEDALNNGSNSIETINKKKKKKKRKSNLTKSTVDSNVIGRLPSNESFIEDEIDTTSVEKLVPFSRNDSKFDVENCYQNESIKEVNVSNINNISKTPETETLINKDLAIDESLISNSKEIKINEKLKSATPEKNYSNKNATAVQNGKDKSNIFEEQAFDRFIIVLPSFIPNYFYPGIIEEILKTESYCLEYIERKPVQNHYTKFYYGEILRIGITVNPTKMAAFNNLKLGDRISIIKEIFHNYFETLIKNPTLNKELKDNLLKNQSNLLKVFKDIRLGESSGANEESNDSPSLLSNEEKFSSCKFFYTNPELPQIVMIAAITEFAIPLLKIILEQDNINPSNAKSSNTFNTINKYDLVGLKYLDKFSEKQARILTPYPVGQFKYQNSLESISRECEKGWIVMVVKNINAHKDIAEIVDNFFKVECMNNEESINNKYELSKKELQQLNILVSQSPELAYNQINTFFKDSELFFGSESACENKFLPQDYLTQHINKTLLSPAPPVSTICLIPKNLFGILGTVIQRLIEESFDITGLKLCEKSEIIKQNFFLFASQTENKTVHQNDFLELVAKEPFLILCASRVNAVKKMLELIEMLTCLSLNHQNNQKTLPNGYFVNQFGFASVSNGFNNNMIFISSSLKWSCKHKSMFFPEGQAYEVISTTLYGELRRQLLPFWSHVPTVFKEFKETEASEMYMENKIEDSEKNYIPEINKDSELCFILYLSTFDTTIENFERWGKMINLILNLESKEKNTVTPVNIRKISYKESVLNSKVEDRLIKEPKLTLVGLKLLMCSTGIINDFKNFLEEKDFSKFEKMNKGPCLAMVVEGKSALEEVNVVLKRLSKEMVLVSKNLEMAGKQWPLFMESLCR
ncbi:hypothetical protein HK099_007176 [Clydaea vesicula]|uniref:Uncharacterized protein n=1 Tax=Clydaea vesicula TaxID=447962 RepID=A0AAD5TX89_9FUNG|nr:hypothetical protein HK099_007176 [Clydaea vesicula]